jgi:hypothetical protein
MFARETVKAAAADDGAFHAFVIALASWTSMQLMKCEGRFCCCYLR